MLYERTYLDKCATIIKDSETNTGLNPISELVYGRNNSRLLIHFDHNKIKKMVNEKVYPDVSKLKHVLKMTNAGSLDLSELHQIYHSQIDGSNGKKRATSFDLIYFLIPQAWDGGKGFDFTTNYFNKSYYKKSKYDTEAYKNVDGVNWYECKNGHEWTDALDYRKTTSGLLTFYIKADKHTISQEGDDVTFSYYCQSNGNIMNANVKLVILNNFVDNPIEILDTQHYAKNGQICTSFEQKTKYGKFVKSLVRIPKNELTTHRKLSFRLEYTIEDRVYCSNPYTITQLTQGEIAKPVQCDGIYSTEDLYNEVVKFENGQESIIIGRQHFDIGSENIELDVTDIMNQYISGDLENHGICIAFEPSFEEVNSVAEHYVGILTNHTHSFFEPYVETTYQDTIHDDRHYFVVGKENQLCLFANIGEELVNLDEMPTCVIEDVDYPVYQITKGVYGVDVTLPYNYITSPTMLYDTWSNLKYKGLALPDVEMEFTTHPSNEFYKLGSATVENKEFQPSLHGISNNEQIKRGDIRKVVLNMLAKYKRNTGVRLDNVSYRLFVMDGSGECEVIPFTPMERTCHEDYFQLDTNILIPEKYYVDIKVNYGLERIVHHKVLNFTIIDDENNQYA